MDPFFLRTKLINVIPFFFTDTRYCEHNQPCHNGGTCLAEEDTFICICPPEYTGKTCEVTTSTPAAVNPRRKPRECQNGGTCTYRSKHIGCQR